MDANSRTGLGLGALLAVILCAAVAHASVESEIAFHRGVVAYGEGSLENARAAFLTVLEEDPEDTSAIHYLGLISSDQGDYEQAIGHFQQALALDPEHDDVRLDLAIALLESNRLNEAQAELDKVLAAEPDNARAQLFAGITDYRLGDYEASVPHFDRAVELDPELNAHAKYYTGLSQAFLGDIPAATGSFSEVEQSPIEPLANSAAGIREQLEPEGAEARRWAVSFTAGGEFDDNPTIVGTGPPATMAVPGAPVIDRLPDGRAVFRLRSSYRFLDHERYNATIGYDSFLSLHGKVNFVDLQTHNVYLTGGANFDPFRVNLRYDFAYTFIDLTEKFRALHRVTPSITMRQGNWGVTQLYYQFQKRNFDIFITERLRRTGTVNTVGFNQFFYLGEALPSWMDWLAYFRIGSAGEWDRTKGAEWSYDSWEASVGLGLALPWNITATWIYRYSQRFFLNPSVFVPFDARNDDISRFSFEIVKPLWEHWEVSVAGTFRWQDANIPFYEYDRNVAGTYVTYRF